MANDIVNKNLGHATAYGYAVSKGFEGTEEEFAELMASYGDVAQTAVDARDAAIDAKNDAVDAKNAAVSAKNDAVGAKDDAVAAKNTAVDAKDTAVSAKNTAVDAKDTAITKAGEASTSATTATNAKNTAVDAKDAAVSAKNDAVDAKNAAVNAKTDAVSAKNDAVDAKTAAVSAKNDAVDAKTAAESARSTAVDAKDTAVTKAGEASQSATDASGYATTASTKAGEASQSATDANTAKVAAQGAQTAAETAQGKAEQAQSAAETAAQNAHDWAEAVDPEVLAHIDGYYEEMTVGNAEQLVATVGVDDSAPYLFRTTGGSADVGDRKTMELVGGTVAWNQLVENGDFSDGSTGWSASTAGDTIVVENGVAHVTNATGTQFFGLRQSNGIHPVVGHRYLLSIECKASADEIKAYAPYYDSSAFEGGSVVRYIGTSWENCSVVLTGKNSAEWSLLGLRKFTGSYGSELTLYLRNAQIFDLTQMFGSTIADYIYALESAHAGDGVAWFRKLFPKDYYDYNAGELVSVKTSAQITTGFNQWDEEWELGEYSIVDGTKVASSGCIRCKNPISVVPGATYCMLQKAAGYRFFYDASGNYLSYSAFAAADYATFAIPENAYYMTFRLSTTYGTTYKNDICINLSWDGERDGEYESYVKHEYPLDSDLELRGMLKLDENNELYYDGDEYQSDGTVTRKYGVVDLGTLYWRKDQVNNGFYAQPGTGAMLAKGGVIPNAICPLYTAARYDQVKGKSFSKCYNIATTTHYIYLYDASNEDTTAEDFKTLMLGVYMVYELETPSSESATTFTSTEAVDDFGTEQFVDTRDVPIPVGHNSAYQANLRAKLEMAPDSPDGDGDYLVRQSNGTNAYIPYILPTAGDVNFDESAEYDDGTVGAELNKKADVDGYYETLTSGLAENLIATVGVDDNVPYNFRTTGGSADVGDRKEMEIVGGTIAWNQLAKDGNFPADTTVWAGQQANVSFTDNVCTVTPTSNYGRAMIRYDRDKPPMVVGHKYLIIGDFKKDHDIDINVFNMSLGGNTINNKVQTNKNVWETFSRVFTASTTQTGYFYVADIGARYNAEASPHQYVRNFIMVDLTQMFGSAIAAYVVGLGDAGALAWFRKLFPKPYYAYNAGELMSVKTSANVCVGFNQWNPDKFVNSTSNITYDSETGTYTVSNEAYQENKNSFQVVQTESRFHLEADMKLTATTAASEHIQDVAMRLKFFYTDGTSSGETPRFSRVGDTYHISQTSNAGKTVDHLSFGNWGYTGTIEVSNICLNLSWDGERDGEYEPYVARTYALDSDLELRGIPKLTADNQLYYDGDTYEADGTVTRRYGIVDMGTLTWQINGAGTASELFFSSQIADMKTWDTYYHVINMICPPYTTGTTNSMPQVDREITITKDSKALRVRDDRYHDAAEFKATLSGVYLVYELATPTEETADPFQTPQIIDDFGTEEFIDAGVTADPPTRDIAIPVGHNTVYAANLRAKLEMAPDSPDGDGDYIVRQTNGENAYVLLEKELPAPPSGNGTYILKLVVSGNTKTYSWEAQT